MGMNSYKAMLTLAMLLGVKVENSNCFASMSNIQIPLEGQSAGIYDLDNDLGGSANFDPNSPDFDPNYFNRLMTQTQQINQIQAYQRTMDPDYESSTVTFGTPISSEDRYCHDKLHEYFAMSERRKKRERKELNAHLSDRCKTTVKESERSTSPCCVEL